MVEEKEINQYLEMQRSQYEMRADHAIVTRNGIKNDLVVGSYELQETFRVKRT